MMMMTTMMMMMSGVQFKIFRFLSKNFKIKLCEAFPVQAVEALRVARG
jgi:hypothetical protein